MRRIPVSALPILLLLATGAPRVALAQPCQHGASIFKTCESTKRSCTNDAGCNDGLPCTLDDCDEAQSNVLNCTIALSHADTCGDTTKITGAFDRVDPAGSNVRVPAVGNLPISATAGNAVCCAGPALPCFVGPPGSTSAIPALETGCGPLALPGAGTAGIVFFVQNTYVVQPTDPDPLPNQGNVDVKDLCNGGAPGCSSLPNTVQFTAATDLVTGCTNTPAPDSTPCPDVDGNQCTTAGCNAVGSCDQAHLPLVCPPDSNPCTADLACDPQTGACNHPPLPDSTPCPDTDGSLCTVAGCDGQGLCDQGHVTTTCTPDTNPCTNDPACNPQTGTCDHPPVPDSTPCPDGDGNLCTTAGCEAGVCQQGHQVVTCTPDSNSCTADPPCNPGTGTCEHPALPDSTPCPDTDGNLCTAAGCESGVCIQPHVEVCEVLNHFSCYEVKPFTFTSIPGVTAVDQFGAYTLTLKRPNRFCAPADKNDEDPSAPGDPDHLTAYPTRATFTRRLNQRVVDQFGEHILDVVRPDYLFVPTAKSLTPPPPPAPGAPAVDHFLCYLVKRSRGAAKFARIDGVKVDDQFATFTTSVQRPVRLCAPVNKNNEEPGAETHPEHLLCYKARSRTPVPSPTVYLGDQFGQRSVQLTRRMELCVPSLVNPMATTTTTTTTSTTTTTVSSPSGAFLE